MTNDQEGETVKAFSKVDWTIVDDAAYESAYVLEDVQYVGVDANFNPQYLVMIESVLGEGVPRIRVTAKEAYAELDGELQYASASTDLIIPQDDFDTNEGEEEENI